MLPYMCSSFTFLSSISSLLPSFLYQFFPVFLSFFLSSAHPCQYKFYVCALFANSLVIQIFCHLSFPSLFVSIPFYPRPSFLTAHYFLFYLYKLAISCRSSEFHIEAQKSLMCFDLWLEDTEKEKNRGICSFPLRAEDRYMLGDEGVTQVNNSPLIAFL